MEGSKKIRVEGLRTQQEIREVCQALRAEMRNISNKMVQHLTINLGIILMIYVLINMMLGYWFVRN